MLDIFQKVKEQKKQIINQKKTKAGSLLGKRNKNISRNSEKFPKNISAQGFKNLKG